MTPPSESSLTLTALGPTTATVTSAASPANAAIPAATPAASPMAVASPTAVTQAGPPEAGGAETAHAMPARAAQGAPAAAEEHESETPELENFWNLLARSPLNEPTAPTHAVIQYFDPYVKDSHAATVHRTNQSIFFSVGTVILATLLAHWCMRKRAMIPNRAQAAAETLVNGLRGFFISILGEKHGPRYIPFLLALFFFILFNNLIGLIPFLKSSTSAFQCNIVLGICVFLYVQYTGLRYNGPKRYLLHLLGNPKGVIMWVMSPLMLFLEVVAELVKPLSLSLRLFGNIMGEDILLGVFAMLGITVTALCLKPLGVEHPWVGIPLQFPFLFLALLTSTIQALIFSLLSCVYILLMLPHEEEHH